MLRQNCFYRNDIETSQKVEKLRKSRTKSPAENADI